MSTKKQHAEPKPEKPKETGEVKVELTEGRPMVVPAPGAQLTGFESSGSTGHQNVGQ